MGALALLALTFGCANRLQTENLLSAAGFKTILATTPQQQQHLKTLPANKVSLVRRNGMAYYVYPDPAHRLLYVGNQFQYAKYRDLRLEKNLAQEDLQTAELNAPPGMGWGVWDPDIFAF